MVEDTDRDTRAQGTLPGGVWLIAGFLGLLLLAFAPRYGWHRDELYFLEAGKHLAWGYVDQPPLTPLLGRLADTVAGGNLVVLRFLPAAAAGATAAVGALTVREMGGSRRAQVAGAGALAAGGFLLGTGHVLSPATFDLLAWMVVLWISARMLRTADPRWWMAIGLVSGIALLNKSLVVMLGVALVVGLAASRRWDLLRSSWIIAGGLLAAAIALPNFLWQASNGWPQLEMSRRISERLGTENRILLIPLLILFVGPAFIGLMRRGVGWLRSDGGGSRYQTFLWACVAGVALTLLTGGRPYYPVALILTLVLAGIVSFEHSGRDPRDLRNLIVINGAVSLLISLPVLPVSMANVASTSTPPWPRPSGGQSWSPRSRPPSTPCPMPSVTEWRFSPPHTVKPGRSTGSGLPTAFPRATRPTTATPTSASPATTQPPSWPCGTTRTRWPPTSRRAGKWQRSTTATASTTKPKVSRSLSAEAFAPVGTACGRRSDISHERSTTNDRLHQFRGVQRYAIPHALLNRKIVSAARQRRAGDGERMRIPLRVVIGDATTRRRGLHPGI